MPIVQGVPVCDRCGRSIAAAEPRVQNGNQIHCAEFLQNPMPASTAAGLPSSAPGDGAAIRCKTCESGTLVRRKRYRLSGPAVVIGYILLIPSILGILVCIVVGLLSIGGGAAAGAASVDIAKRNARTRLEAIGVPASAVSATVDGRPLEEAEESGLTSRQRQAITEARQTIAHASSGGAAAGGLLAIVGSGTSLCAAIGFFVNGLLGWLLTMKKTVLQCTACGTTVAAS